ncbi:hypothetical protein [Streptomyces geranii]|uniref:hypothetical protein n=1 Tax=Streptomyces geranii TaxID=2058923 RepID=UPI000D032D00|nr:hypothetical protein [Streptomyces geranii]
MTVFWNAAAGKLVERWLATGFAASVYWLVLSVLWLLGTGRPRAEAALRLRDFGGLGAGEQVALLLIGLVVLAASSLLMQQLTLPALRLLEGYWPRWAEPLSRRLRERYIRRAAAYEAEVEALLRRRLGLPAAQGGGPPLDVRELVRLGRLEERLRWTPRPERTLATPLGNTLRAAETEPLDKYGLDATVLWPHLWTLLPDLLRQDLAAARRQVDSAVAAGVWGLLLLPAAFRTPWALLALPFVYVMWCGVLPGACREFGVLMGAAFDLHRGDLYRALRHPLPADAAAEIPAGERLTAAVLRGSDDRALLYVPDP